MTTQREQVRRWLADGWTCGTIFLHQGIPRYPARIHELRRLGHRIERRPCANPYHAHRSQQYQWRIV